MLNKHPFDLEQQLFPFVGLVFTGSLDIEFQSIKVVNDILDSVSKLSNVVGITARLLAQKDDVSKRFEDFLQHSLVGA